LKADGKIVLRQFYRHWNSWYTCNRKNT